MGEKKKEVQAYVKIRGLSFPVLLDAAGSMSRRYGVWATPTHVLVDAQRQIVAAGVGPVAWDRPEVLQWVRQTLKLFPLNPEWGATDGAVQSSTGVNGLARPVRR